MSKTYIPAHYHTPLNVYEMQRAIEFIKSNFQVNLSNALNLRRVSAPLFVEENSGLNDNLNGVERPVSFDIPDVGHRRAGRAFASPSGSVWRSSATSLMSARACITDMNAIRRDEELDNLHSIYVDQWDWEKVITRERPQRLDYLQAHRARPLSARSVEHERRARHAPVPQLHTTLSPRACSFITTAGAGGPVPRPHAPSSARMPSAREHRHRLPDADRRCAALRQARTTAARPTTTTGRSTAIFCSGTTCWTARLRSPPWASASDAESLDAPAQSLPAARSVASCRSTRCCSPDELPLTIGGGIGQIARLYAHDAARAHIGEVQVEPLGRATPSRPARNAGILLL